MKMKALLNSIIAIETEQSFLTNSLLANSHESFKLVVDSNLKIEDGTDDDDPF